MSCRAGATLLARSLSASEQAVARKETLGWIRDMAGQGRCEIAEPNYIYKAQAEPVTEPLYTRQWHYGLINMPLAWQLDPVPAWPIRGHCRYRHLSNRPMAPGTRTLPRTFL